MLEAQAEKRKLGKVTVWASVPGFLTVDTTTSQQFQDFTSEFGVGGGGALLVSWEGEPLEWVLFPFEIKLINVTECSLSIALFLSLCFLCVIHLLLS